MKTVNAPAVSDQIDLRKSVELARRVINSASKNTYVVEDISNVEKGGSYYMADKGLFVHVVLMDGRVKMLPVHHIGDTINVIGVNGGVIRATEGPFNETLREVLVSRDENDSICDSMMKEYNRKCSVDKNQIAVFFNMDDSPMQFPVKRYSVEDYMAAPDTTFWDNLSEADIIIY